jgi:hypothetical protein
MTAKRDSIVAKTTTAIAFRPFSTFEKFILIFCLVQFAVSENETAIGSI